MTDRYQSKITTAQEAVGHIKSGDSVYIHSNAAAPPSLIDALTARTGDLQGVKIYQLITLGKAPYADIACSGSFYVHTLFIGPNTRQAVAEGRADYTPVFFSEAPRLFYNATLKVDVCLLQCSPPDSHGNMTMGVSLDCTPAARSHATLVIAEVNRHMPRTFGDSTIHVSQIDHIVENDHPLPELTAEQPGEVERAIGKNVASLVEDGATIQMGIGAIPNAVLNALHDKRDLGVHSEMFSDGVLTLVEQGVITNSKKTLLPGVLAVSFLMGSKHLYDFVDNNPAVELHPSEFINDPYVIAQNHKMTAINSAIQVDLTGQVCADSLGFDLYSGCGGQVDFIRGASRADNGKAIIALPSTARGGSVSRITASLAAGAGVVTSRADVHFVVTEYGIADLHGKNMKDRVKALIAIAHPAFRSWLEEESSRFKWLGPSGLSIAAP